MPLCDAFSIDCLYGAWEAAGCLNDAFIAYLAAKQTDGLRDEVRDVWRGRGVVTFCGWTSELGGMGPELVCITYRLCW